MGGGWVQQSRAGAGPGIEARPQPGGSQFLVAVEWLRQLPALPAMVLPLAWLSRCCRRLLPSWAPTPQSSWRCCSQNPRSSTAETSSTRSGKMSPSRVSGTKEGGGDEGKFVLGGRESLLCHQRSAESTPGDSDDKESTCTARDLGSIAGLGRSPRGGHGNPLQYSCLDNPHGQRSLEGCSSWGQSPR